MEKEMILPEKLRQAFTSRAIALAASGHSSSARVLRREAENVIAEAGCIQALQVPDGGVGEVSDGYHTFNELYHHRAVLFAAICNACPNRAWKSLRHSDGTMFDGMFIVGIETEEGQATYHYDVDPYWDMFDCAELESAPEYDGHTPDMAISRIANHGKAIHEAIGESVQLVAAAVSELKRALGCHACDLCRPVNEDSGSRYPCSVCAFACDGGEDLWQWNGLAVTPEGKLVPSGGIPERD